MSSVAGSLVLWLLVFVAGHIQGLHISMERTPDTNFCARLKCVADVEDDSKHIQSIIGLKIYKLTLSHRRFKLASVSVFDPSPHLELAGSNVFNVTGTVSLKHGDLMLGCLDESECLYGSFLCELNLLNSSGQPAVMTKLTSLEAEKLEQSAFLAVFGLQRFTKRTFEYNVSGSHVTDVPIQDSILLSRMAARLEAHSADVAKDMGSLEAKFDNLLSHLLTLEQLRNESYETPQLGHSTAGCGREAELVNYTVFIEPDTDPGVPSTTSSNRTPTVVDENNSMDMCYKGMPRTVPRVKILLWNNVLALCDTDTDGGGWIIFQRRTKGDVNFYRNWDDYKNGFGDIDTDYWLGNDVISNLTSLGYNELRVDLKKERQTYFAHYSKFNVADETLNYQLTVSGYDGTAGDGLSYHNSQFFSTYDRDNDKYPGVNCAVTYSGAWWYHACHHTNLNGLFGVHNYSGAAWGPTLATTSADFTEMKIRQG